MWRKKKKKNVYVCGHTQEREKKKIGAKEREKEKKNKNPRQCKKDITRDDKSSEDQEKCKEECDDVENESSIFHTMCNPTSRTSLVP
jgi:hypothetical protein